MSLTSHYLEVAFGPGYVGLVTVGYALKNNAGGIVVARTTTGVFAVAGGTYGVSVPTIADTVATIEWDTGGGTPIYAHEDLLPALRRGSIYTGVTAIDARLPSDPADESLQQAAHGVTQSAIAALNNLSQAGVQSALTAQGLTTTRAGYLDRLDAAVSSRAAPGAAMDLVTNAVDAAALDTSAVTEIQSAILSDATPFAGANVAAILADTAALDARLPSDPADESLQQASHTATQSAIAALNDLSQADVETALTAQGYTTTRAPKLDQLDAAVSSRSTLTGGQAADAVWDEALSGHLGVGSTGKALSDAGAGGDPGAIADAVWDEALVDHLDPGSTGKGLDEARVSGGSAQQIAEAPTVWPPVAGSLLDRLTNADVSQTYDASTDSLEALRNRIG